MYACVFVLEDDFPAEINFDLLKHLKTYALTKEVFIFLFYLKEVFKLINYNLHTYIYVYN